MNLRNDNFILPKDFRFIIRFGIPASIIVLFAFVIAFLRPIFTGKTYDILPNVIASAFFLGVGIFLLVCLLSYYELACLQYYCDGSSAFIQYRRNAHHIHTNNDLFISELPVAFSVKGGIWHIRYYVLSSCPLSEIKYNKNGGLQLLKELYDQNVVMLPVNADTQNWLVQTIRITQVPQYPRTAYVPRNKT